MDVTALATLLPEDLAERWKATLRPGVRLRPARAGEPIAAVLGGEAELPEGMGWPESELGPIPLVASVRCEALNLAGFPDEGTLLFFHRDGDGYLDDPEGRVVHVPPGTGVPVTSPVDPFPRREMAAETITTAPAPWHPLDREVFAGRADAKAFLEAASRTGGDIGHRIGGHAKELQGPVEIGLACEILGEPLLWDDPRLVREALSWVPLAQFESEDGMDFGGWGVLYWLIGPEDLAARRFDRARTVVQV